MCGLSLCQLSLKVLGAEPHLGYLGTWGLVAVLSMPALVLATQSSCLTERRRGQEVSELS